MAKLRLTDFSFSNNTLKAQM